MSLCSIELALSVAEYFRLSSPQARQTASRGGQSRFTMETGSSRTGNPGGGNGDCGLGLRARGPGTCKETADLKSGNPYRIENMARFGLIITGHDAQNKFRTGL